jgi:hypothetical protein
LRATIRTKFGLDVLLSAAGISRHAQQAEERNKSIEVPTVIQHTQGLPSSGTRQPPAAERFDDALTRYLSDSVRRESRQRRLRQGQWFVILAFSLLVFQWPYAYFDAAGLAPAEPHAAQPARGVYAFASPSLGRTIAERDVGRLPSSHRFAFAGAISADLD